MTETTPQDSNPDFKLTPFTPLMQKAALEAYTQAKEAVQELQDKFRLSSHDLSAFEPLIQQLLQNLQKYESKEFYKSLKQKIFEAYENFDFLKEEKLRFEKTQNDLLGNLSLHLQNLGLLKEDILKSPLTEAEPQVAKLETHLQDLKQKIADYSISLSKAKENFNNNHRELTAELEQCSKELENLQASSTPQTPIFLGCEEKPSANHLIKSGSSHGQAAAQIFLQFVAKLMKEGKIPLDAKGPHYGLDEKRDLNLFMKDFKEYLKIFTPEDYLGT